MPEEAKSQARDGRQVRVLVFAASLRSGSLNERLAALAAAVVQEHGAIADRAAMADFDCPSYDADVERETGVPAGAQRLRDRLVAADAFVIASPEYNASMPGYLKNAIEVPSIRLCSDAYAGQRAIIGGEHALVAACDGHRGMAGADVEVSWEDVSRHGFRIPQRLRELMQPGGESRVRSR